jgi:hypothetical protein
VKTTEEGQYLLQRIVDLARVREVAGGEIALEVIRCLRAILAAEPDLK